jgi:large subunit ribosomal protein L25
MTNIELNAEVRGKDEKLRILRSEKIIPAVVYGKTQEPISIKIPNSDLLRAYRKAGESTIINLKVGKKDIEVLIHQIQRNPIT